MRRKSSSRRRNASRWSTRRSPRSRAPMRSPSSPNGRSSAAPTSPRSGAPQDPGDLRWAQPLRSGDPQGSGPRVLPDREAYIDTSKARVLVVGDVMLDRYWFGEVARISPEAPVPVVLVNEQREELRLGGASNA